MAANALGWVAVAAVMAGVASAPLIDATAETRSWRATKQEVIQSCRAAGGLEWGMEDAAPNQPERADRYGCISNRGWIACDGYGNCAGGSGAAQRLGNLGPRPASPPAARP